jgi:uncharacterized protein
MAALKRNDPCPCGSGKKYKKCCLQKLNAKSRFDQKDYRDFNELLPKIFDYSKKFDDNIKPVYENRSSSFASMKPEDAKAFSQLMFHWMLFNWKDEEKQTVLEQFIKEHQTAYSNSFQKFLENWTSLEPRFFYVVHADKEYLSLKDMWKDTTQTIQKTPVSEAIEAGRYVTGYLYPTPDGLSLGSDALELPADMAEAFLEECRTAGIQKQKHFTKRFDSALQLLYLLVKYGKETPVDYRKILQTLQLESRRSFTAASAALREYLAAENPRVTKPEAFAAVLEYWAGKHLPHETPVSQKAVADKYGISSSTLSSRYKQFMTR